MERHSGAVFQQAGGGVGVLPLQTITVRKQSDNTLASLFSDDGVTPKANPFTSGADGEFFFYAANGRYKVQIGNPVFETREDILLHDPGETRLPTSSNDHAVARFDGVTGNVQDSPNGPFGTDAGQLVSQLTRGALIGGVQGPIASFPNNDFDDANGVGWYLGRGEDTNSPTGISGDFFFVQNFGDTNNFWQVAYTAFSSVGNNDEIYVRWTAGGWQPWVQIPKVSGFQMTGALDFRAEQSVASASTVDLGAVAGNFVQITGTTTITAFGTAPAGTWRLVRFAAALTLTHNGTSLILPGAANITTAANDTLIARSLGSGNWFVSHYHRATGVALRTAGFQTTLTASSSANLAWSSLPAGARRLILKFRNLVPATADVEAHLTVTEGGTRQTGASDYQYTGFTTRSDDGTNGIVVKNITADSKIILTSGSASAGFEIKNSGPGLSGWAVIENPESTTQERHVEFSTGYERNGGTGYQRVNATGIYQGTGTAVDGFDIRMEAGNIASGEVDVYAEF